jgi:hypothetical protein
VLSSHALIVAASLAGAVLLPLPLCVAQAWTPEKGEGAITLTLQDNFVKKHLGASGEKLDIGHIRAFIAVQDVDFGITDKLAIDVSLPFVLSRYYGPRPHQLPIDNGNYHGAFQDVRMNLRYNVRTRPFMLTPFVALGVPSNSYVYFAHSAAGTLQREYVVGCSAGRGFAPILARAYGQAAYSFVIPEKVMGIRTYRSRLDWDVGDFLTDRLAIRTLGALQIGHSGLNVGHSVVDLGDFPIRNPDNIVWFHHDQTSRISFLNIGAAGSFALNKSWSLFAALTTTVWGRNGHALSLGEVFGVSWRFRTPLAKPRAPAADQPTVVSPSKPTKAPPHVH